MTSFTAMSGRRRQFGRVRRLSSGRFQARYPIDGGQLHRAPTTFATEAEAERFPAEVEMELARGTFFDPNAGDIRLDLYAPQWMTERPVALQPRTGEVYDALLTRHIYPAFGATAINRITSAAVRTWHASLREQGVGQVTAAKACRLLKAILATALEDELIPRSPCRLKPAGVERSPERKPPSLAEVELVAASIERRYRMLVALGAWSRLRWGELCALPPHRRSSRCAAAEHWRFRWRKEQAVTLGVPSLAGMCRDRPRLATRGRPSSKAAATAARARTTGALSRAAS